MPPKSKVTKEQIITAALELVQECGADSLNARGVAARLGTSTQPIFSHFHSMEDLKEQVIHSANSMYQIYVHQEMSSGKYPPYKSSGMAYIRFAREERELFKLLFMRDRTGEEIRENRNEIASFLGLIQQNLGLSEDDAYLFHLEMWVCVHGIATMVATNYLPWDAETISRMLTDSYQGLRLRYIAKEE